MLFVTDRTLEDVIQKKPKGYYGVSDLNRVEEDVKALSEMSKQLDIHVSTPTKTDWKAADGWMTRTDATRYLSNVSSLVKAHEISANVPRTMDNLDYNEANNIEKSLQMVLQRIIAVTSVFNYSGEFFAGEEYL